MLRRPPAAGGRWSGGGAQSQVLQGFLSLLCVPVISVGICPLAKGLVDVRGSLRVGQAPLVPGEKAKQSLDPRLRWEGRPWVYDGRRLGYSILLFYFFTLIVGQLLLQQKHLGLKLIPLMQYIPQLLQREPWAVGVLEVQGCFLCI